METLIIRADASPAIGHGHVMRCLALAQAWQDRGGRCVFISAGLIAALEARLKSEGFEVVKLDTVPGSREDAEKLVDCATQNNARCVVIDGYHFAIGYQHTVKAAGFMLLVIDDYGQIGAYAADIILDQNAGTHDGFYQNRGPDAELLLGARDAMLRREFRASRGKKHETAALARKILILLGGSDSANLTMPLLRALQVLRDDVEVTLVAGASNRNIRPARDLVAESAGRWRLEVEPPNLPELISSSDVAITSAGSACWEMCLLGLPLIVIPVAQNQFRLASELERRKVAVRVPLSYQTAPTIVKELQRLVADTNFRAEASKRAQALVDGRGAERAVAVIRAHTFSLRQTRCDDCLTLWKWANDPQVRRASFSIQQIGWDEHNEWFFTKLRDPRCFWMLYEDEGKAVGTIRVDADSSLEGEISLTLAPQYRGQGLASHLLKRSLRHTFASTPVLRIRALVKCENIPSARAFENAGFTCVGKTHVKGYEAYHYSYACDHVGTRGPALQSAEPAEVIS
jgi:UDP-2,4-diacetamido-2,4,6-trideoxy-beta-L-altropyranose hydrolase